ncbi:MAG: flagellar hook-basal body complex protein [Lachnospiraceae bacterium]|nr:flagellar hook-basal body complex protein [Lachnospiraceae bacterium]
MNSKGDSLVEEYGLSSINEIATFGGQDTITETTLYQLLDTAEYDSATDTYNMKYLPANILDGYATNQLVNAATLTSIANLKEGQEIKVGDPVTVTGKVKLSKAELLAEKFNLIYADYTDTNTNVTEKRYYGDDGNGKTVPLANKADSTTPNDLQLWENALKKSFPGVKVKSILVGTDGTVEMEFEQEFKATKAGKYHVKDSESWFTGEAITNKLEAYGLTNTDDTTYKIESVAPDGQAQITRTFSYTGNKLVYDTEKGLFDYIGSQNNDSATLNFNASATSRQGTVIDLTRFTNIDIDFSLSKNYTNGGSSTASMMSGDKGGNNLGTGRKPGEMTGIEIAQDGKITAYYDNSCSKLLGQIAVANFANASGLAKQGDNLYSATANSGEFDGIGDDITANDGYMTSGVLEMSNVDLSQEFTEMITTQRGFQANSRIITTSDSLLEELVNLKR